MHKARAGRRANDTRRTKKLTKILTSLAKAVPGSPERPGHAPVLNDTEAGPRRNERAPQPNRPWWKPA